MCILLKFNTLPRNPMINTEEVQVCFFTPKFANTLTITTILPTHVSHSKVIYNVSLRCQLIAFTEPVSKNSWT